MPTLRPARPDDAWAVAAAHVRSWQAGYRGLIDDGFLDALRPEDRVERYDFGDTGPDGPATVLAVDADAVCGFVTTGRCRDPDAAGSGEILGLYVDPDHWHRGVGRALLAAGRAALAAGGFPDAVLWVLHDNARAQALYRADGWAPDGRRRREDHWGVAVTVVRFRRALP